MKKLYVKFRIFIAKIFNPKADYIFWYSKQQASIPKLYVYWYESENLTPTFKGKPYSEMKNFKEYGIMSNWEDAVIVGIGTNDDIVWIDKSKKQ